MFGLYLTLCGPPLVKLQATHQKCEIIIYVLGYAELFLVRITRSCVHIRLSHNVIFNTVTGGLYKPVRVKYVYTQETCIIFIII